MNNLFAILAIGFASLLTSSCSASKQEQSNDQLIQSAKERMAMDNSNVPLPPNSCRVVATIESIDKTLKGMNANDPCGKAPCVATVRIDSVLGYGSSFPKPLAAGTKIQVRFAHTLDATKDAMPEITPPLPGLSVGSTFAASITSAMAMGNSQPSYTIYGYEKK